MKRFGIVGAAAVAISSFVAASAYAGMTTWEISAGGNGHGYEVVAVTEGILWDAAKAEAEAKGGYLAVVTSEAENLFIYGLADPIADVWDSSGINTLGPWLGGYQEEGASEPSGGWSWITGEEFSYEMWGYHQPSNNGDHLNMYGLGASHGSLWNDYDDEVKGYVVEYVPEPTAIGLLAIGGLFALRRQ